MKFSARINGKYLLAGLTTLSLVGFSVNAFAAAYQLPREFSAVEIGDSGAGGAALANDATTAYSNPAGLVRIPNMQLSLVGTGVFTKAKFSGTNTWAATGFGKYVQAGTATTDDTIFIPAFFYAMPINSPWLAPNKWSFGFGASVPFGLSTDYPDTSIVRYSATISKLSVVDLSPSLAYRLNDQMSLGAGIDFDRVAVDFRKVIGVPTLSPALDATSKNTPTGWGYGAHAGVLYEFTKQTRVGLAVHTTVKASVSGNSTLSGPLLVKVYGVPTGQTTTHTLRTRLTFPPSVVLSGHHEFNSTFGVDGSAYYTHWSSLPGVQTTYNLAGSPPVIPTTVVVQQHYRNTWMFAVGGSYHPFQDWIFRAGVSYDQSPVNSNERNVTLPDSDRTGLSVGAHYDMNKQINFDAGYMHLFFNAAPVSIPLIVGKQVSTSVGKFSNSHADLVALQMNWNIV